MQITKAQKCWSIPWTSSYWWATWCRLRGNMNHTVVGGCDHWANLWYYQVPQKVPRKFPCSSRFSIAKKFHRFTFHVIYRSTTNFQEATRSTRSMWAECCSDNRRNAPKGEGLTDGCYGKRSQGKLHCKRQHHLAEFWGLEQIALIVWYFNFERLQGCILYTLHQVEFCRGMPCHPPHWSLLGSVSCMVWALLS